MNYRYRKCGTGLPVFFKHYQLAAARQEIASEGATGAAIVSMPYFEIHISAATYKLVTNKTRAGQG